MSVLLAFPLAHRNSVCASAAPATFSWPAARTIDAGAATPLRLTPVQPTAAQARTERLADCTRVELDGWAVYCRTAWTSAGPGLRAELEVAETGAAFLVDREEWNDAHPGVEPTQQALDAALDAAADEVNDEACSLAREE